MWTERSPWWGASEWGEDTDLPACPACLSTSWVGTRWEQHSGWRWARYPPTRDNRTTVISYDRFLPRKPEEHRKITRPLCASSLAMEGEHGIIVFEHVAGGYDFSDYDLLPACLPAYYSKKQPTARLSTLQISPLPHSDRSTNKERTPTLTANQKALFAVSDVSPADLKPPEDSHFTMAWCMGQTKIRFRFINRVMVCGYIYNIFFFFSFSLSTRTNSSSGRDTVTVMTTSYKSQTPLLLHPPPHLPSTHHIYSLESPFALTL